MCLALVFFNSYARERLPRDENKAATEEPADRADVDVEAALAQMQTTLESVRAGSRRRHSVLTERHDAK